jgi:hypothetical protein
MRVTLAVHGGLAAGINLQRPPREVDAETLPPAEAQELARLVDAALAAPPPGPARPVPDAMSYTVTVERDGTTAVLSASDTSMSAEFADLLGWLEKYAA